MLCATRRRAPAASRSRRGCASRRCEFPRSARGPLQYGRPAKPQGRSAGGRSPAAGRPSPPPAAPRRRIRRRRRPQHPAIARCLRLLPFAWCRRPDARLGAGAVPAACRSRPKRPQEDSLAHRPSPSGRSGARQYLEHVPVEVAKVEPTTAVPRIEPAVLEIAGMAAIGDAGRLHALHSMPLNSASST